MTSSNFGGVKNVSGGNGACPPPLAVRDGGLALTLLMRDHTVVYVCVDDVAEGEQVCVAVYA